MTIGKRIGQIRILKGYTQKEFADLLNQSDKTISKWEIDNGEPNTQSIKDICNLYGLSRDYLYDGTVLTDGDRKMEKELDLNKKNKLLNEELESIYKKCEIYLNNFGLEITNDIAPFIDSGKINYNAFIFENGEIVKTSYEKLVELKRADCILKFHKEKVSIKQALDLDSPELLESALEIFSSNIIKAHMDKNKLSLRYFFYDSSNYNRQFNEYFHKNNIFSYLENLDSKLNNYFKFIVMLIDAGGFYYRESPYEYVEGYTLEKDVSRTNFFYTVAKEHIKE